MFRSTLLLLVFFHALHCSLLGVETVIQVEAIEPDSRDIVTDGFGSELARFTTRFGADISVLGYDALLSNPQDARTSFYSLNRREKVNYFRGFSFQDRTAFLLTNDEILVATGPTVSPVRPVSFRRYNRDNGSLISDEDLGLGTVDTMAAFGPYTALFSGGGCLRL